MRCVGFQCLLTGHQMHFDLVVITTNLSKQYCRHLTSSARRVTSAVTRFDPRWLPFFRFNYRTLELSPERSLWFRAELSFLLRGEKCHLLGSCILTGHTFFFWVELLKCFFNTSIIHSTILSVDMLSEIKSIIIKMLVTWFNILPVVKSH